jgi:hypothetical protein
MESIYIHLFHILIVGGLFFYVGITKSSIPNFMYLVLLILGIVIILYHGFKIYKKMKEGKNPWVNYIHFFYIGPLLIFIGFKKEKTHRLYFELVLMLAFASIGYHGYYLFQ